MRRSAEAQGKGKKEVRWTSTCECVGCHGSYRWDMKVVHDAPPATIPSDHQLTVSEFASWEGPDQRFHKDSPRRGRELEWFAVTGRLARMRAEDDGDLHVQLVDTAAKAAPVNVIVEIPQGAPWCEIRREVLGWTTAKFPFTFVGNEELPVNAHPLVRVIGRPFYDGQQAGRGNTASNRRRGIGRTVATIWEIHPVMKVEEVRSEK